MNSGGFRFQSARGNQTATALLIALALAVWLVRGPATTLWWTSWGPDQPWAHRDLLGALWLWSAEAHEGTAHWLTLQNHPDGAPDIRHHIPNPFDAWLFGPLLGLIGGSVRSWWGAVQLAHHLGNISATVGLSRTLGARWYSAAAAGVVVAATPVMLHEVAGGRGLSGAVWPGLWALALAVRGRGLHAGFLVGLQGLFYLYTGALVGLIALLLRPSLGLLSGASLVLLPYLAWLSPLLDGLNGRPPPADYSILPLASLWGDTDLPARQRLSPWCWIGLLAAIVTRRWRWAVASGLAIVIALGPTPGAKTEAAVVASPLAWLMVWIPALGRMHHPVRAILLAVPVMAAIGARAWPRMAVLAALGALLGGAAMQDAAAWGEARSRTGMAQALWLAEHADGAVLDLTGAGAEALALQPIHQRPMLEGLRKPMGPTGAGYLRKRADGWLSGQPQPGLDRELAEAGFTHVLVLDRQGTGITQAHDAVHAALGPPVYPSVYAVPILPSPSAPAP
ncbi:MAG: hypothetical protein CL927_18555 [Deltaproteobacteria bacterium]|nr:hypothetical protein [Deltaproteobacteria bacterium]HCH62575.1 hypothetical protein [Deltaproteobacteria bacterium]